MYPRMHLLVALLALAAPLMDGAGDAPIDRTTLRGLKTVGVVVDKIDAQLQNEGLTPQSIESEIEGRLKSAGIPVDKNSREFLGVKIWGVRAKKGPYSLAVVLGLYQPVILSRDQTIRTATETWEARTIASADPKAISGASLNAIDLLVDQFAQAWKSVNH